MVRLACSRAHSVSVGESGRAGRNSTRHSSSIDGSNAEAIQMNDLYDTRVLSTTEIEYKGLRTLPSLFSSVKSAFNL